MTVQTATRMWSRDDCSLQSDDGRNRKLVIREGWEVVCDPEDTPTDILDAPGLPKVTELYQGISGLRVTDVRPKRVGPVFFRVDVTYEGETTTPDITVPVYDSQPLTYHWSKVDSEEAIDEDINGQPIATANREPFFGITKTITDVVLNIEQKYQFINIPATLAYLDSVNSDAFPPISPFAAGQGHMIEFSAKHIIAEEVNFGSGYFLVNTAIKFRQPYRTTPDKVWWKRIQHKGFYERDDEDRIKRARDLDQQEVVEPVFLDVNGRRLADGAAVDYRLFQIYQPLPYNALGFRWP